VHCLRARTCASRCSTSIWRAARAFAIPNARAGRDIRVMRGGADWPRMQLRYSLESNGQVLKSGEAQLSSMDYMDRVSRYFDSDTLRYEKQMIDTWFAKEIGPVPGSRRGR
jgi:hypothetical protein